MKLLLSALVLAGVLLPLSGCESVTETRSENEVRIDHAMLMDLKQIPDDIDRMLYVDRPVWLSRYPVSSE